MNWLTFFLGAILGYTVGYFLWLLLDAYNTKADRERTSAQKQDNWRSKIELDLFRIREQLNRIEGRTK